MKKHIIPPNYSIAYVVWTYFHSCIFGLFSIMYLVGDNMFGYNLYEILNVTLVGFLKDSYIYIVIFTPISFISCVKFFIDSVKNFSQMCKQTISSLKNEGIVGVVVAIMPLLFSSVATINFLYLLHILEIL